jgi:hypothetical protein
MRSNSIFDRLAGDLQLVTTDVGVQTDFTPFRHGGLPLQLGQLLFACCGDQPWFGPVGPIAGEPIATIADDQVEFFRSGDINVNVDRHSRRQRVDRFRLEFRLLSQGHAGEGAIGSERDNMSANH